MNDYRQVDPEEVAAWDEKVRDSEFQRRLEAFWSAEGGGEGEAEGFIRDQQRANDVAKRITEVMEERPNKVPKLDKGVVSYRCRQGCLLAAVVPDGNGVLYLSWRRGPGVRRIPPEELNQWREGEVPQGADDTEVRRVLDIVDEFKDRYGVAPGYRTDSGREAESLGRGGEPGRAKAARLSELPPDGVVRMTCKHAAVELRVEDVRDDLNRPLSKHYLPRKV